MRKIGILAGTFDPVHAGHLAFAELAMSRLNLERVVFMPEHDPRRKKIVTDFKHRLTMLRLAVAGHKQFELFDTNEKFFTLEKTLQKLVNKYNEAFFVFLVGSDVARTVANWPGIDKTKPPISFSVALRSGDSEMSVRDKLSQPAIKPKIDYYHSPAPTIAASVIRAGIEPTGIAKVDAYIARHHLYS